MKASTQIEERSTRICYSEYIQICQFIIHLIFTKLHGIRETRKLSFALCHSMQYLLFLIKKSFFLKHKITLSVVCPCTFLVVLKVYSIVTVLKFVLGRPLLVIPVSSLRCYTCCFRGFAEVNLEPLIKIICSS